MSTLKSPGLVPNQAAFEIDMRKLLRGKKRRPDQSRYQAKAKNEPLSLLLRSLRYRFGLFRKSII